MSDQADEWPVAFDTSDLVFTEASPLQRQLVRELNGASSTSRISPADYAAREQMLSEHDLCKDGHIKSWVLHPSRQPEEIVASCEATRKAILISENGKYRRGYAYAIANIRTTPAYRRLGLAALLLRKVQESIDRDSDCSILYSTIGRNYYASLGWTAFHSYQATIHILRSKSGFLYPPVRPERTRYLSSRALRALCEADVLGMKAKLRSLPPDGRTHVAIVPSFAQISWHLARSEFMAEKVYGKKLTNRGAIVDNGSAWVYWDHDWSENELRILRVVTTQRSHNQHVANVQLLLEAAVAEASSCGLSKVALWNPDESLAMGCKAVGNAHETAVMVVFEERGKRSVPSLRWRDTRDTRDTVWVENNFYSWC